MGRCQEWGPWPQGLCSPALHRVIWKGTGAKTLSSECTTSPRWTFIFKEGPRRTCPNFSHTGGVQGAVRTLVALQASPSAMAKAAPKAPLQAEEKSSPGPLRAQALPADPPPAHWGMEGGGQGHAKCYLTTTKPPEDVQVALEHRDGLPSLLLASQCAGQ